MTVSLAGRARLAYAGKLASIAWRGIQAQRLRAWLGAIGVAVGIAAVIGILALGEGAREEVLAQVRHLGTKSIIVRATSRAAGETTPRRPPGLTLGDASRIERSTRDIVHIAASLASTTRAAAADREAPIRLVGTSPEALSTGGLQIESGRFLAAADGRERRRVCVIGAGVRRDLFPMDPALGGRMRIDGDWFEVVGALRGRENAQGSRAIVRTHDIGRDVYVPFESIGPANLAPEDRPVGEIALVVANEGKVLDTAGVVRAVLERARRGGTGGYEVIVPLELLAQRRKTQRTFAAVLAGVAALSLLVGGIGIMGIMLATVTERTHEVGVRRAVGATGRDIALQFLAEAAALSSLGGAGGAIFGIAGAGALKAVAGWPVALSAGTAGAVLLVSVGCGLVFGLYPALKAASVDPIEALRYE